MNDNNLQQQVTNLQPADNTARPQPPIQSQPLMERKSGMSKTQKIIFGILLPVLFIAGFGSGFLTKSFLANNSDDNQQSQDTSVKPNNNNVNNSIPAVTKIPVEDREKPDINGVAANEACKILREAGWTINRVADVENIWDRSSCVETYPIAKVDYYTDDAESEYYGVVDIYYKKTDAQESDNRND